MTMLSELRRQLREAAERVQGWKCLCHSELNEGLHTSDCLATMTHWEEEACTPDNIIRLLDALDRADALAAQVDERHERKKRG